MRLAWNVLREEFPSLVCFGCAAHGLSLYAKDIAKIPEIKTAACNANTVLKWLKFKHLPHAILNEKCMEICHRVLAVILSVDTRWGSVFYSLTRLLQLRIPIEQTVMDLRLRSGTNKPPEHISARRRRIPPPPPVEIFGAAAAEFSIPPPLNFSAPPPKQIRRRAEYNVSNTILPLCSAVVISSVSMDNINTHAARGTPAYIKAIDDIHVLGRQKPPTTEEARLP
jgi:hypothetical protein